MWFFSHLLDILFPLRDTEARVRNISESLFLSHLSPVLDGATNPATTALFSYRGDVRAVIHEAKYRGNSKAFNLLGVALGDYLLELSADEKRLVIVPIPLSKERMRERGFNQCEEISRAVKTVRIPLHTNALVRIKDTEHQTNLSGRARRENARGAFTATLALDPHTSYIVLDDVITTGSTMQSAIDALRAAGAARIIPLAIAH